MLNGHWIVMLAGHNQKGELVLLLNNTDGEHNFGYYVNRWVDSKFKSVFGATGCSTSFHRAFSAFERVTSQA